METQQTTKAKDRDWILWALGVLATAIGGSFAMLHSDIGELETKMDKRNEALHAEMVANRAEAHADISALRSEIDKRFEQTDKRFEQIDKRFEQVHADNAAMQATLNQILLNTKKAR